ncbi:MAG: hypothetical protein ACFFCS_14135 [Candidatus Hodarchaeota archaeon]
MKLNLDAKQIKNLMILGIILAAVGAPVCYLTMDKFILAQGTIHNTQDSDASFQFAYNVQVDLYWHEKVTIIFSGDYDNITSSLRIYTKAEFDRQWNVNTSDPGSETGLPFIVTNTDYDTWPDASEAYESSSVTCGTGTNRYLIEFSGETDGSDYLRYIEGTYVIVVYGDNSEAGREDIQFDITVKKDGPGRLISNILILAGICLVLICALALAIQWINKTVR